MDILDALNEQQRAAVTAAQGPVLVLAGPGSGKTRVLTHRIAHQIHSERVPPWHVLAVTFTNKAAREMRHRVDALLDGQLRGLMMGTFHASCVRILRREADNLAYYDRNFVIFDTADQRQVVKQALTDLNLDDKKFPPNKMLHGISSAKNELITPDIYQATTYIAEVNRRVYDRYQAILQANNAMDFDDLLLNTVLLFDEQPEILQKQQDRYQHILVDEFQDTNATQYALLQRLAAGNNSIFVVGDSDQSIYRWRGADYRNIHRFRETYPNAQEILLEQNYRSTQVILDAAKSVIRLNQNRVHKELFTEREGGTKIVIREAYNDLEEADTVIATIQNLMLEGHSPGDCAVMYRTNAQSRSLEEAFIRANMPYRLVGATQFYQRREVKDIVAYLRLVHNPADSVSLNRVLNVPPRGIGKKTQQDLLAWAGANMWHPADALLRLATDPDVQHPFRGRAFNSLSRFGSLLHNWISLRDQASVSDLMDLIFEQIEFRRYVDDGTQEGQDRWANVMELYGVAASVELKALSEFLEEVALVSEADNLDEHPSATTLLTLHAAKGLEFPVVFIVGIEDGMLPHSRSLDDGESLAEERRLFYVGITRARDRLYLSHVFRRTFYGETEISVPSRFLGDIPVELIDGVGVSQRRQRTKARVSNWSWSSSPTIDSNARPAWERASQGTPASAEKSLPEPRHLKPDVSDEPPSSAGTTPQYQTGQKVSHAKFGEGIVIESKRTGNDEEVTVAFTDAGIKRLAASFAKLQKLES
jgi:DNA helicase-2/ATP-dependent DNA helicase PcrA